MSFKLLTESDLHRLSIEMRWAEQQMGLSTAENGPNSLPGRMQPNVRGYILQNIHSGGKGAMWLAKRIPLITATQISIVGTNYVANSSFKLALYGTPLTPNAAPLLLCTSQPISVQTDATEMKTALTLAAQGASLPVGRNDITVSLGNPTISDDLVIPTPADPAIDGNASPPESYVGSWIIEVSGALAKTYSTLSYRVVQDTTAFMRGLSALVSQPVVDLPSDTSVIVHDVSMRPTDYPWVAGSLCIAIPFLSVGYGIISSNFRNQDISIPVGE